MVRPTKTKEWPNTTNKIRIMLNEHDLVQHFETNTQGKVRTNKRGYQGFKATVVLGIFEPIDNYIEVPANVPIWECEFVDKGDTSTIGYPGQVVTLIIHQ